MAKRASGSACILLAVLGLAAACRRAGDDQPVLPPDKLANAIEDVREEKKEVPPGPPKRLAFLLPADLASVSGDVLCTLRQHDRTIMVAGPSRALARVDGRPTLLARAGPMDSSAAFFEASNVTISIGRHAPIVRPADAPGISWPVGVTVGGRPNVEDEKIDASWACRMTQTLR